MRDQQDPRTRSYRGNLQHILVVITPILVVFALSYTVITKQGTLILSTLLLSTSLLLTAQGISSLYLMLYTWARPERLLAGQSPKSFLPPDLRFTIILPARHEQAVIAQTIQRVWNTQYPKELLEVVVVCEHQDVETIVEAQRAIDAIGHPHLRVITFNDGLINKPHALNVALKDTRFEVVTIFDAEDDVHQDIFQIVNTIICQNNAGVVQSGVQLMDFQSSWYASHNVLEYFFWFRSRLHFHARVGAVPLGGNTIFIKRELIESVGGWDETCLTEDADVGIRLSLLSEPIVICYDAEHATREETPPTLGSFIKQRTRWNQGFLQVFSKRDWLRLPSWKQRLLAGYTLVYPFLQALMSLLWVPAVSMMFALKVPISVAMVSLLPVYIMCIQYVISLCGLFEFAKAYRLRVRLWNLIVFTLGFPAYQIVLSLSAIRAVLRQVLRQNNWEKTEHTGAHRTQARLLQYGSDAPPKLPALAAALSYSDPTSTKQRMSFHFEDGASKTQEEQLR